MEDAGLMIMLLVTHDLDEAVFLADPIFMSKPAEFGSKTLGRQLEGDGMWLY